MFTQCENMLSKNTIEKDSSCSHVTITQHVTIVIITRLKQKANLQVRNSKNLKDKVLCSFEKRIEHLIFLLSPQLDSSTVDYVINSILDNQVSTYFKFSLTTSNDVILLVE